MPAKQVIMLDQVPSAHGTTYRFVLWADVPAAVQSSYRDPKRISANLGRSLAELSSLRAGSVREKVVSVEYDPSTPQASIDSDIQSRWSNFNTETQNLNPWTNYGRFWNGTAWTAGSAPPDVQRSTEAVFPTFFVLSGSNTFTANRWHFILFNNASHVKVRVLLVLAIPVSTVVTAALASEWTLRRRRAPTTPPGGGLLTAVAADALDVLPSGITIHSVPTTSPVGGTLDDFLTLLPNGDELKLTTLDIPGYMSVSPFGGSPLYDASKFRPSVPLSLRTNEALELQQSATAGVGNCKIFCVFTVEDER